MQIDRRKFKLAAQDAYPVDDGGFTGEVSFAMLAICAVLHRRPFGSPHLFQ